MNFKDSLIENDSIVLDVEVNDWKEAIQEAVNPLISAEAVTQQYVEEIIKSTNELGPYYVLLPNFAMPHARPGDYVKKDAFSFITLKKPVYFSESQPVKVIVCLAAKSSENHLEVALPQIADVFSDESIFEKIDQAKTKEDILELL
ncbi:PTS sugar transporter subunit IIA [Neobacillus niacini]|uniref:PTS sugar transporter subunit IIA n=1 Tax=Neobacillus niacini TaxID=86668 RepID=UPI00300150B9